MNVKFTAFAIGIALAALLTTACSVDKTEGDDPQKGTTFVSFSIKFPTSETRALPDDYNRVGTYEGSEIVYTVDLYLESPDGTLLYAHRFVPQDMTYVYDDNGMQVMKPNAPFKTTAGDKKAIVVINCPHPLLDVAPDDNYMYQLSSSLPLSGLADFEEYEGVVRHRVVMSGKSAVTTIEDGVDVAGVQSGQNTIALNVSRIASKVIVTLAPDWEANTAATEGTLSNIQWAVGQGTNSVYLFPQDADGTYKTWGFDYIPSSTYYSQAATYYTYSGLHDLVNVPLKDMPDDQLYAGGQFLLENTHTYGADASTTTYRKGNTAYVMVSVTYTPKPEAIEDGGTLAADGTFYVGATDGNIYSSLAAATDPRVGTAYQKVMTYAAGKALYFAWLNPDNIAKPMNSPVIRNHIYHVNINSFKRLGQNWNPLNPDINNPNPKPSGDEPDSPILPTDPLSLDDTYMSVDIGVLDWTVHSYDIDLE
jgi:hypothetical protein